MKVKFLPQEIEIEITPEKSVLQLAHENNIPIRSVCKGVPNCAECRVRVVEGEHNLLPPTKAEVNLIGSTYFVDQRRLACQLRCFGDVTVDITEHLEREDSSTKKLRGVKHTVLPTQTRAVQGTLVLDEAPVDESSTNVEATAGQNSKPNGPQHEKANSKRPGGGQKRRRHRNRRPRKKD